MKRDIKCGDKVICKITDFEGIVTAITEHINGCVQCLIVPKVGSDGKYPDGVELDIQQLERVKSKKKKIEKSDKGGPAKKRLAPTRSSR